MIITMHRYSIRGTLNLEPRTFGFLRKLYGTCQSDLCLGLLKSSKEPINTRYVWMEGFRTLGVVSVRRAEVRLELGDCNVRKPQSDRA